jgi:hypothetical protein
MFLGGLLYPDASASGVATAEVAGAADESDCAARATDAEQATSTPVRRQFREFQTGMGLLRFDACQECTSGELNWIDNRILCDFEPG